MIGCGHMGSALLKSWTSNTKNKFYIIDPLQYKKINNKFKNKVTTFNQIDKIKNLTTIDIIIFAVKPQIIQDVLKKFINLKFKEKILFISIVAGKKINFFNNFLQDQNQFIRAMPNMPALIDQGMTCLVANKNVDESNRKFVNSLFTFVGKTLWLKKETDINKITAISGSGPAYVFLFIDAFEQAALKLGLENKVTKNLVKQTFLGSLNLFLEANTEASILANNIAVKGGTTEAALKKFKNKKILHKVFSEAVKAAFKKANELGK